MVALASSIPAMNGQPQYASFKIRYMMQNSSQNAAQLTSCSLRAAAFTEENPRKIVAKLRSQFKTLDSSDCRRYVLDLGGATFFRFTESTTI